MNKLKQNHKKLISEIFNETADLYGTVDPNYYDYAEQSSNIVTNLNIKITEQYLILLPMMDE